MKTVFISQSHLHQAYYSFYNLICPHRLGLVLIHHASVVFSTLPRWKSVKVLRRGRYEQLWSQYIKSVFSREGFDQAEFSKDPGQLISILGPSPEEVGPWHSATLQTGSVYEGWCSQTLSSDDSCFNTGGLKFVRGKKPQKYNKTNKQEQFLFEYKVWSEMQQTTTSQIPLWCLQIASFVQNPKTLHLQS